MCVSLDKIRHHGRVKLTLASARTSFIQMRCLSCDLYAPRGIHLRDASLCNCVGARSRRAIISARCWWSQYMRIGTDRRPNGGARPFCSLGMYSKTNKIRRAQICMCDDWISLCRRAHVQLTTDHTRCLPIRPHAISTISLPRIPAPNLCANTSAGVVEIFQVPARSRDQQPVHNVISGVTSNVDG